MDRKRKEVSVTPPRIGSLSPYVANDKVEAPSVTRVNLLAVDGDVATKHSVTAASFCILFNHVSTRLRLTDSRQGASLHYRNKIRPTDRAIGRCLFRADDRKETVRHGGCRRVEYMIPKECVAKIGQNRLSCIL